ncbi:MAG: prepilin-type N-terminal cleavage/methylation domain-containing protein [Rhodocyclaceae bacterium]
MKLRAQCYGGFTLVEVLVALAITSLLMSLLMGANFYILQIQEKLADEVRTGEQAMRDRLWFRHIVAGLQPMDKDSADAFVGSPEAFRGWVARPLEAGIHVAPARVELALIKDDDGVVALRYTAHGVQHDLARWPASRARFTYHSRDGKIHDTWTAFSQPVERIPSAIGVVIESSDGERPRWYARVDAHPWLLTATPPPILRGTGAAPSSLGKTVGTP